MKKLWILGEAVQDLTVEIDLELLIREHAGVRNFIQLDAALWIKDGTWLTTQAGLHSFAVEMQFSNPKHTKDGLSGLVPGEKYNLTSTISESLEKIETDAPSISVRLENLSWGGGGLNVAKYIRALAPLPEIVPIVYTDVAMNPPLAGQLQRELAVNEKDVIQVISKFSADRYLEVYLESLATEPVLYQPENPQFRRNVVISRVRASNREIDDKIICRSSALADTAGAEQKLLGLLNGRSKEIGAILVNSIKSQELFNAAYSVCKANPEVLAMFALTDSMQKVADPLIEDLKAGKLLENCILIFNELELYHFAQRLKSDIQPFMTKAEDIPNLKLFGETVRALLRHTNFDHFDLLPRIYVTLGPRGSLGFDHQGHVVYVSTFNKQKATIFDTNSCGDAFCAGLALQEWAKRCGPNRQRLAPEGATSEDEMRHFMAVATAAAYSRATSRLGRVDSREVEDLLNHGFLASEVLGRLGDLKEGRSRFCDEHGFLLQPRTAYAVGIEPGLAELMSTKRRGVRQASA